MIECQSFNHTINAISVSLPTLKLEGQSIIGYPFFPISAKLEEYSKLNNGWHFGEGRGPTQSVIAMARDASLFLQELGITKQGCFPGVFGEMRVTGYLEKGYVEITYENNGTISLLIEDHKGETITDSENVSSNEMKLSIRNFVGANIWNMSGYFAASIGMPSETGFKVLLSKTPLDPVESTVEVDETPEEYAEVVESEG